MDPPAGHYSYGNLDRADFNQPSADLMLLSIENIQQKFLLKRLKRYLNEIKEIYFVPQFIFIHGYNQLPSRPEQCWKDRLSYLLANTAIPHWWILDLNKGTTETDNIPHSVFITLITPQLKEITKIKLERFVASLHPNVRITS